jgi:hypothetical protein
MWEEHEYRDTDIWNTRLCDMLCPLSPLLLKDGEFSFCFKNGIYFQLYTDR